jgi:general secretion pathway protein N
LRKIIGWGSLALVSYLLALVIQIPAHFAYEQLAASSGAMKGLTPHGISGTLWSGKVTELSYQQQPIGQLAWDIDVVSLLLGKLGSRWQINRVDGALQGEIEVDGNGLITLKEVDGTLAPASLLPLLPFAPFSVDGTLLVDMQEVQLKQQIPSLTIGSIRWQQAQLTITEVIDMGTVHIDFETSHDNRNSNEITVGISNQGGAVTMAARIKVSGAGQYQLNGSIQPRLKSDAHLLNMLAMIGKPDRDGVIHFNQTGKI